LNDGVSQLRSYIRAHVDQASIKPKTVLGVVTDGNRWLLMGLNRTNEFHTIAAWAFLTDDPRLIAQRLWLMAKPALAQPTSALVEFLGRRTLAEVLKDHTRWLTKKVNERLPDGNVSEELIGRWLRDAFSDPAAPPRLVPADPSPAPTPPTTAGPAVEPPPPTAPEPGGEGVEPTGRRITLGDLLRAGLLQSQDLLMVEGTVGRRQTATVTPEGKISVAGQLFDAVSPAALRALELAGRVRKATNGWATFHVLRGGSDIGTLLEIRGQYEDREEEGSAAGPAVEGGSQSPAGPDAAVLAAAEQLRPLLAQLPELSVNMSKSTVSLYAGKLVVGYAQPRKRGLPRLRVYAGETCPGWATADPTYEAWCYVDDWSTNLDRVVVLFREAAHHRAEDMTAGRDAYRRRAQPPGMAPTPAAGES
jgi:Restriction Enzyme Adenine Methylase Associated